MAIYPESRLPTPDACIKNEFEFKLAGVAPADYCPPPGWLDLDISYDDGVTWQEIATAIFAADPRTIGTGANSLTGGFKLRFRVSALQDSIYVEQEFEPASAPAGSYYTWTWSGDASGTDSAGLLQNGSSSSGCFPDTSHNVTVTAERKRTSDNVVLCSSTDTKTVGRGYQRPLFGSDDYVGAEALIDTACDVVALAVTLSAANACPDDVITVTASHALTSALLRDGTGATLATLALTYVSDFVYTFIAPDEPTAADILFTTDAAIVDVKTKTVAFTRTAYCAGDPCVPPAPNTCFETTKALRPFTITAANYPVCATALKLQTKTGAGAWTDLQTGIVADVEYSLDLDIAPDMKARFVSDDDTPGAEIDLLICDCGEGGSVPPDEKNKPAIPAAPTLAKNCATESVLVTSPAFSAVGGAVAKSIEIRRRVLPDGDWIEDVHTFTAAGDWDDEDVFSPAEYEYSARACNAAGCSAWSTPATVSLISTTLALTWQSPAPDANVTGKIVIRFSAIDAGAVSGLQVFVNGALAGSTPTRKSGNAQNGIYTLVLDTRRAAQGAATIEVRGVGSDGCLKASALDLTFANTRALGVLYRDFHTDTAIGGQQITRLPLSIALGELDADRSRRYWGQVAVTKDMSTPVVTTETEPADAQAAFDAMQPFPLQVQKSWPQLGANPPGSILGGSLTLNTPGAQILIRVRQEQAESFLAYDTGGETIPKIREIAPGKFLVFAQNPDKVFVFENDALTLLADIENSETLSAVSDVALLADKVYFIDGGGLYARDTDGTPARTVQYTIHSEGRAPTFVESVGTKLICVLVGATGDKTLAVSIEGNQISDAWTLAEAATLAWMGAGNLYIACGTDLYISANGTTAPVLVKAFSQSITAIAADGATAAIGLADGSLQVLRQGVWGEVVTPGGAPIDATTIALLDFEFQSALWGKAATATLFGQDATGSYDVTRALGTYDGVASQPTGISALARYFTEGAAGEGEEEAVPDDERVLVGTTGGVLLALSVARQSSASAWLHSSISDLESGAIARLIPVEA